MQLELVQCFGPRLPPEAVELLTVHTNDIAQIAVPPEDSAEHVVEFEERHVIGDRDQADDHRAHLAQNRTQNQAFEADCFSHLSRLPRIARPPDFLALSNLSTRSFGGQHYGTVSEHCPSEPGGMLSIYEHCGF